MTKKAVIISSVNQAEKIQNLTDAYLIPLKDLSINYTNTFTIDEIKKIKKFGKEIFIFINKNIHNSELGSLEKKLKEIDRLNINGIIFYDISVLQLKKELSIKTDLVWHQEHLSVGIGSVNYYYSKGVKYAYLSSEITKREIYEIKKNTKAKLFVNVFGYIPMFTSKRNLVKNYIETFDINHKGNKIYKEGKYYNIIDEENGTFVLSDYILNIKEKLDIDYIVYNSEKIPNFEKILENNDMKENTGFLYKETIYKVK